MMRDNKGTYSSVPNVLDAEDAAVSFVNGGPPEDPTPRWENCSGGCGSRSKKQYAMEHAGEGRGAYVLEKVYKYVGEGEGTHAMISSRDAEQPEEGDLEACSRPKQWAFSVTFSVVMLILIWLATSFTNGNGKSTTAAASIALQGAASQSADQSNPLLPVEMGTFRRELVTAFGTERGAWEWAEGTSDSLASEYSMDFREFQRILIRLDHPLAAAQARYAFSVLDANQDMRISKSEFVSGVETPRL